MWSVHSLRSRLGMLRPARHRPRLQARAEVLLLCTWLTISEVVKGGPLSSGAAAGFTQYFQIVCFDPEPGLHHFSIMRVGQMKSRGKGDFTGQVCDSLFIYIKGTL